MSPKNSKLNFFKGLYIKILWTFQSNFTLHTFKHLKFSQEISPKKQYLPSECISASTSHMAHHDISTLNKLEHPSDSSFPAQYFLPENPISFISRILQTPESPQKTKQLLKAFRFPRRPTTRFSNRKKNLKNTHWETSFPIQLQQSDFESCFPHSTSENSAHAR